jgi:hypothetical protein
MSTPSKKPMKLATQVMLVQDALLAGYPSYYTFSAPERRLLAMAILADKYKVREVGGNNTGPWVNLMQQAAGCEDGDPWCASAETLASMIAKAPCPVRPDYNPAAVIGWREWATDKGKIVLHPSRGCLAMHHSGGAHGHIGTIVSVTNGIAHTIEANTSADEEGSQDNGGGMFRRNRPVEFWDWGFAII